MESATITKSDHYLEIESLRIKLLNYGIKYGLSHPTTVYLSQELDKILNKLK